MSRRAVFHRKAAGRDIFHFDLSGHEHLFQKPGENFGDGEPLHPLGGEDGDGVPHLAVQRDLELPEHIAPLGAVAIGRPDKVKEPNDRYETEKVFFGKYEERG